MAWRPCGGCNAWAIVKRVFKLSYDFKYPGFLFYSVQCYPIIRPVSKPVFVFGVFPPAKMNSVSTTITVSKIERKYPLPSSRVQRIRFLSLCNKIDPIGSLCFRRKNDFQIQKIEKMTMAPKSGEIPTGVTPGLPKIEIALTYLFDIEFASIKTVIP